jgi:phosphate starvation-inducible PhoH-like protein
MSKRTRASQQPISPSLKSKQRYPQEINEETRVSFSLKSRLRPKNVSQEMYLESLRNNTLTFGVGPAGSGKTYLVCYVALEKLMNNEIDKIILTRPVVEADEKLGFLPGDLNSKLHPYLIPLMDAIEEHVGPTLTRKLVEAGKIEIAPLAFMRGRTFNNCLTGDSLVLLSDGSSIRIDDLVTRFNSGEKISVVSYNHSTEEFENTEITYAFKQKHQNKLLKFTLADGTVLKVTKDHKLYVKDKGYVEAQFITSEDELVQID